MALGHLIPLVILLIVVGVAAFIGYHLYVWSNELAERANKKMAQSNVSFTKEGGLRVGVKDIGEENYADKTQNVLVNVWNNAALPNYKSRLGWNSTQADPKKLAAQQQQQQRPSSSRSTSSVSVAGAGSKPGAGVAGAPVNKLAAPANSVSRKRSTSPLPGGWE